MKSITIHDASTNIFEKDDNKNPSFYPELTAAKSPFFHKGGHQEKKHKQPKKINFKQTKAEAETIEMLMLQLESQDKNIDDDVLSLNYKSQYHRTLKSIGKPTRTNLEDDIDNSNNCGISANDSLHIDVNQPYLGAFVSRKEYMQTIKEQNTRVIRNESIRQHANIADEDDDSF